MIAESRGSPVTVALQTMTVTGIGGTGYNLLIGSYTNYDGVYEDLQSILPPPIQSWAFRVAASH